jgi:hypothetical protein
MPISFPFDNDTTHRVILHPAEDLKRRRQPFLPIRRKQTLSKHVIEKGGKNKGEETDLSLTVIKCGNKPTNI